MQKHHTAFSLVGSEVTRVHQELNTVKGAVEQVAQAVARWDSCYSTVTAQNGDTSTQSTSGPAVQVNVNQMPQSAVQDLGSQASPTVPEGHAVQSNAFGSPSQAGVQSASQTGMQNALGSTSQAGTAGAMGPNAWDPWRAATAATTPQAQP